MRKLILLAAAIYTSSCSNAQGVEVENSTAELSTEREIENISKPQGDVIKTQVNLENANGRRYLPYSDIESFSLFGADLGMDIEDVLSALNERGFQGPFAAKSSVDNQMPPPNFLECREKSNYDCQIGSILDVLIFGRGNVSQTNFTGTQAFFKDRLEIHTYKDESGTIRPKKIAYTERFEDSQLPLNLVSAIADQEKFGHPTNIPLGQLLDQESDSPNSRIVLVYRAAKPIPEAIANYNSVPDQEYPESALKCARRLSSDIDAELSDWCNSAIALKRDEDMEFYHSRETKTDSDANLVHTPLIRIEATASDYALSQRVIILESDYLLERAKIRHEFDATMESVDEKREASENKSSAPNDL